MRPIPWPPRPAVLLALALVAALGVVAGAAGWAGGAAAALGVLLGALAGIAAGITAVGWATRVAVAVLAAGAFWLGTAASASAWWSGAVVAVAALALLLRVSVPPQPTARGEAVLHAVATALVAGGALAVARALDAGHGYRLVIALTVIGAGLAAATVALLWRVDRQTAAGAPTTPETPHHPASPSPRSPA